MLMRSLRTIPRFALPYTPGDFNAALLALIRGTPPLPVFRLLGGTNSFWTRSGRQALRLLLTGLDLRPGSGIALPLFTDPSLVEAIIATGHRPVYVDVDPQLLTMSPRSLDAAAHNCAVVVVTHLFGHVADMPALLSTAKNIPIIEDTAHAPLSFLNGRRAGTFGLASFYSFASTKYMPAGGGGLAVVHDSDLARQVAGLVASLRAPSRLGALRNLILQGMKSAVFRRPLYGTIGMPLRRRFEAWALLEPRLDLTAIEPAHAAAALRQESRFEERVYRQRSNSLRLLSLLDEASDIILPRERLGARYNYHLFPVLLRDSRERGAVAAQMWKSFIDTSMIYSGAIDECRKFGYQGGCPVAESVAGRLLTLPNHASLSENDIDRIAEVFLSSLAHYRNAKPRYPLLTISTRASVHREIPEEPYSTPV